MDAALLPAFHDVLVVAQTGSVIEAARRLHKTSSAVSQQVRRVEDRFGVKLFDRVGRRLRPSASGEALLGALTRLFAEASSVEGLLEELASARVTTLRVAAADYLGEALLRPVLRRLFDDQVPLRFEITTINSPEARRLVAAGHVDAAVVSTDRAIAPDEIALCRQSFCWVAPRPRHGRVRSPTALLGREPLLRLGAGSQGRRLLDEFLGRSGLRAASTIDVPSVSLLLSYVRNGLGVGLAPHLALNRTWVDRASVLIQPADVPEVDVRLMLYPALKRSAPVRRFIDELVAEAQRAPGRDGHRRGRTGAADTDAGAGSGASDALSPPPSELPPPEPARPPLRAAGSASPPARRTARAPRRKGSHPRRASGKTRSPSRA
ncbi:MAG TPA: LysR family transcriptional regulator [Polyangia bacterium]